PHRNRDAAGGQVLVATPYRQRELRGSGHPGGTPTLDAPRAARRARRYALTGLITAQPRDQRPIGTSRVSSRAAWTAWASDLTHEAATNPGCASAWERVPG